MSVLPLYAGIRTAIHNEEDRFTEPNEVLYISIDTPLSYISFEDKPEKGGANIIII